MRDDTDSHYEIHYKLLGESYTDRISNLDVPITDVVRELACRHLDAINDERFQLADIESGQALVVLHDVSIHRVSPEAP